MAAINYDNKFFTGVVNYDEGDATRKTVFRYRQKGEVVWGSYEGGGVLHGNFVAKIVDDGKLEMVWQYLSAGREFHVGTCVSTPEVLPDGRIRLHEAWKFAEPDGRSGNSVIEELGGR